MEFCLAQFQDPSFYIFSSVKIFKRKLVMKGNSEEKKGEFKILVISPAHFT